MTRLASTLIFPQDQARIEPRLTIELVPRSTWYINVRSEVSKENWDRLRRETYRTANYRCEICGGRGPKWPVECHEIWEFDLDKKRQILTGLSALCPDCHQAKHYGRTRVFGREQEAFQHLMAINRWTCLEAEKHVLSAMEQWAERSEFQWTIDFSWLREKGIDIPSRAGGATKVAVPDPFVHDEHWEREIERLEAQPAHLTSGRHRRGLKLSLSQFFYLIAGGAAIWVGLRQYLSLG